MKKILLMALPLMAAGFVSCSDDDEPVKGPEYEVITFSDCEFATGKTNNVVSGGGSYSELGATFAYEEMYTMISGAVVSDLASVPTVKDQTPKALAVALEPTEGDANKFGVLTLYSYVSGDNSEPAFSFADGEEREVVSIDVMNSTEMYQYMTIGWYSYAPMADGDWCVATFTGYDAQGAETGSVDVTLADFRNGQSEVISDWTTVDMTALGKVNKIGMTMKWSDTWSKPSASNYSVCIDNVKMIKAEKTAE